MKFLLLPNTGAHVASVIGKDGKARQVVHTAPIDAEEANQVIVESERPLDKLFKNKFAVYTGAKKDEKKGPKKAAKKSKPKQDKPAEEKTNDAPETATDAVDVTAKFKNVPEGFVVMQTGKIFNVFSEDDLETPFSDSPLSTIKATKAFLASLDD